MVNEELQRWCQQCCTFHPLSQYDGTRRSPLGPHPLSPPWVSIPRVVFASAFQLNFGHSLWDLSLSNVFDIIGVLMREIFV